MASRLRPPVNTVRRGLGGFSLVELLIALLISSLLLLGVMQIFVSSRDSYKLDEGLSRMQESGRFAASFLEREIRMAGNVGCRGKIKLNNVANYLTGGGGIYIANDDPANPNLSVAGFEAVGTGPGSSYTIPTSHPANSVTVANWGPSLDLALAPAGAIQGSDIIVVRYMGSDAVPLTSVGGVYSDGTQLYATYPNNLAKQQVVVMSDCENAAIFQIDNVTTAAGVSTVTHGNAGGIAPGNVCATWGLGAAPCAKNYNFSLGATIGSMQTSAFYVAAGADGTPSLWRTTLINGGNTAEELVSGIENLQVVYGLDTNNDGNADQYVPADLIPADPATGFPNWRDIVSVRIGIMARTYNTDGTATEELNDTTVYNVAGTTITPNPDRQRRRVFNLAIKLRNR
jgi:type IV pilus assembly protein PilW